MSAGFEARNGLKIVLVLALVLVLENAVVYEVWTQAESRAWIYGVRNDMESKLWTRVRLVCCPEGTK